MSVQEANEYVKGYFEFNTEARSYMQDQTETGVFNKADWDKFDGETKIAVAEDLQYQVRQEVGMYF